MDERLPGFLERDADRVVDVARRYLVVPDEPREDRQPGRVGGRPVVWAEGTRPVEVEQSASVSSPRIPEASDVPRDPCLVQLAVPSVDNEYVAIRPGLDGRVRRDGI